VPLTKIIKAPRLIDGTGSPPIADGVVVITDSIITDVGPASSLNLPSGPDVEVLECPGSTILPGLIDSHVHLLFSAADSALADAIGDSDQTLLLRGVRNAQAELLSGVTTVRDCGGRGYLTLGLRDGINQRIVTGPRILASGGPITTTGGHLNFCNFEADGVAEVTKMTRTMCKTGVDFVKIMATGGGMTPRTNARAPQFTVDELSSIVREARRLGRHTAAHCHATAGIANAVEAGVTTIEHCSWLASDEGHDYNPKIVERMIEKGTYVCLTMGSERASIKPDDQLADWQKRPAAAWEPHFDLLRRTIRAGVRFIASSDAGVQRTLFEEYPMTLEVMVSKLEIDPLEAIYATTGRAAEAIEIADQVGALRPGLRGDVLVVEGDPVSDIRALRNTRYVLRDGRVVVDGKLLVQN
jgi:imidazolonepropionase-like amidohydrolase